MRHTITLGLLVCLALSCFGQYWDDLEPFNQGAGAFKGSALCAGVATEPDGATRNSVWMLHGSSVLFERYSVATDTWDWMANFEGGNPGVGGALAFAPDPFADPLNGWVFAF